VRQRAAVRVGRGVAHDGGLAAFGERGRAGVDRDVEVDQLVGAVLEHAHLPRVVADEEAAPLGARGAVGSTYNFAAPLYRALITAYDGGDRQTAAELQALAVRMINTLVGSGAHPVATFKWFMGRVGVDCGPSRLPLNDPTPEQIAAQEARLEAAGIFAWVKRKSAAATAIA
jgi:hypothetical protein